MKSSRKSSSRSWLLDCAMLSSVITSSYAWSLRHASSFRSLATRASSLRYEMLAEKVHGLGRVEQGVHRPGT
jgi:hypothetical protein